jgi:hypothetical protein
MMEGRFRELLDKSLAAHTARELRWWKQDRRGRWVVLEPGPGRLLKDSPRHIRDYVDTITEQRGRRFSSLSRARKFARAIGGAVRRWQRKMPGRGPWRLVTNPWERAIRHVPLWICAPKKDDPCCCEQQASP